MEKWRKSITTLPSQLLLLVYLYRSPPFWLQDMQRYVATCNLSTTCEVWKLDTIRIGGAGHGNGTIHSLIQPPKRSLDSFGGFRSQHRQLHKQHSNILQHFVAPTSSESLCGMGKVGIIASLDELCDRFKPMICWKSLTRITWRTQQCKHTLLLGVLHLIGGLHKLPVTFGHPGRPLPSFDWSEASLELSITDVWSFFKLLESDEEQEISPDSRLNLENLCQWHVLLGFVAVFAAPLSRDRGQEIFILHGSKKYSGQKKSG